LICLLVSILTQLEGWMQQASLKKRHSREGEWPLRTQETQDLHHTKTCRAHLKAYSHLLIVSERLKATPEQIPTFSLRSFLLTTWWPKASD